AVDTIAGQAGSPGGNDGTNSDARLNLPSGVAVDASGTLYITDYRNSTIRRITPIVQSHGGQKLTNWVVSTMAGSIGISGSTDGTATNALFNLPIGIALNSAGRIYVADTYNNTIREINSAAAVSTLAGSPATNSWGSADGTG